MTDRRWLTSLAVGLAVLLVVTACSPAADGEADPGASTAPTPSPIPSAAPASSLPSAATTPALTAADAPPRPNIVIVMIDDANPHDARLWSKRSMPRLHDLVISRGIAMESFHGEVPLCCPARANILSGQHAHNSGQVSNNGQEFDPSTTLATELRDEDYFTIFSGKYLNGYPRFTPDRLDPPGWSRFDVFNTVQGKYYWYKIRDKDGRTTQHRAEEDDYSTDVIADLAVKRLAEAPAKRPLFAFISVYAPHTPNIAAPRDEGAEACADIEPWAPPNYDEEDISDKPAFFRALPPLDDDGYDLTSTCESLRSVDRLIGRVGRELERQGRLEDTVFIFLADNGINWGEHRYVGKASPYSTAIPMFVAWPAGRGSEARVDDTYLNTIDIAPTLCELAGCEMGPFPNGQPTADGLSFATVLRDEEFPYLRESMLHTIPTGSDRPVFWSVRTTPDHPMGLWYYVEHRSGEVELYDDSGGPCHLWDDGQEGDPCQLQNLLYGAVDAETEARAALLAEELARLRAEVAPTPVLKAGADA